MAQVPEQNFGFFSCRRTLLLIPSIKIMKCFKPQLGLDVSTKSLCSYSDSPSSQLSQSPLCTAKTEAKNFVGIRVSAGSSKY